MIDLKWFHFTSSLVSNIWQNLFQACRSLFSAEVRLLCTKGKNRGESSTTSASDCIATLKLNKIQKTTCLPSNRIQTSCIFCCHKTKRQLALFSGRLPTYKENKPKSLCSMTPKNVACTFFLVGIKKSERKKIYKKGEPISKSLRLLLT